MGNTGAGLHWLAEARHESAFRHWQNAATAAPVRQQGHARGEVEVFLSPPEGGLGLVPHRQGAI